jgi:hypothetical protein
LLSSLVFSIVSLFTISSGSSYVMVIIGVTFFLTFANWMMSPSFLLYD